MATFDTAPTGSKGKFVWYVSTDGTALQIGLSDGSPLPGSLAVLAGNYLELVFSNAADALATAGNLLQTVDPTLAQQCQGEAAVLRAML